MNPEETFRLRRELAAMRSRIEELSDTIKEHSKAIHSAQEAQQRAKETPKPVPVVVAYNEQTARDAKTENDRQYGTQNSIKNWTRAAVIAASIYAGIAGLTWWEIYKQYTKIEESADAAKRAADTARDALHISERAYLADGAPSINFPTKSVTIPFPNSGHIPSGAVQIVIHEATINVATPTAADIDLRTAIERHWGRYNFQSIPPAPVYPIAVAVPVPQMSEALLDSGRQTILLAGFIAYNDGFPDTTQQQWFFCQRTSFQNVMNRFFIGPCKPGDDTLRKLEMLDGYPNNPEQ